MTARVVEKKIFDFWYKKEKGLCVYSTHKPFIVWSRLPDLNRRSTDYESVALPTEPKRQIPEMPTIIHASENGTLWAFSYESIALPSECNCPAHEQRVPCVYWILQKLASAKCAARGKCKHILKDWVLLTQAGRKKPSPFLMRIFGVCQGRRVVSRATYIQTYMSLAHNAPDAGRPQKGH